MIKGYRQLSQSETDDINRNKEAAEVIAHLLKEFEYTAGYDKHWLAIARTNLQQGFMAITRAIARPEGF